MTSIDKKKPSGFTSFIRYNIAAFLATSADFSAFFIFTTLVGIPPVSATAIGATIGAIVAFILGRNWAFVAKDEKKSTQALKYALVALGSIGLNTVGMYLFYDILMLDYKLSRVIAAGIVAVAYNYPMSKYFIFEQKEAGAKESI